ncbi:hypothetical protein RDI58_022889 [Solanum bulbocastanum]|uniref:Uncharacterized protein n=1 Tax=Solanum bulbocastanum TaxID=147425 RepID=A0AAN8T4Y3_SOLBU
MGKNYQMMNKERESQGQGVCEKSFKLAVNKPVTIVDQLELNRQQIPSQNLSTASNNMVLVEYNHLAGENSATTRKFKGESMKDVNKSCVKNMITIVHHHEINEGPKDDNDRFSNYIDRVKNKMRSISSFDDKSDHAKTTELKLVVTQKDQIASNKVHVECNHSEVIEFKTGSPVHMLATRDCMKNQDYTNYNDTSSNDRFSRYIDHVKSKIMSSYDDDEHDIDSSKFEIRTTAIACGGQG